VSGNCGDVLGIPDGFSTEGALARLLFLETTDLDKFVDGIYPLKYVTNKQGEKTAYRANPSKIGFEVAFNLQVSEMQAVAATVYNIKAFIDTYPSDSYPDAKYAGFTNKSNVLDVIYSNGGIIQYEGHSTNKNGYRLSQTKYDKVQNTLDGSANSAGCYKLSTALAVARDVIKNGFPSEFKDVIGMQTNTVAATPPSKNYEKAIQVDFSGNIFYRLKQSYIDSVIKSNQRVKRK
jgi:hypothetical protein